MIQTMIALNAKRRPNRGQAFTMSLEDYDRLTAEPWLAQMIDEVRGGDEKLKGELPFRCAHYGAFKDNHRSQKDAVPESFLFQTTVDVDDKDIVQVALERAMALNQNEQSEWYKMLLHADYSARNKLHLDIRMPIGMTIEEAQREYCKALDIPYDESAATPERLIYISDNRQEIYRDEMWYAVLPEEELDKRRKAFADRGLTIDGRKKECISAPISQPNRQALSPSGEMPKGQRGASLPYHKIIPAFFQLECQTYPDVPEGLRNTTLFAVCAKYLRYCTDSSFERMKELLWPQYAFGLGEAEVDSVIRSALSRERSLTPKVVKYVLGKYSKVNDNDNDNDNPNLDSNPNLDDGNPYRPLEDCIMDEAMLPQLPRWLNVLLKVAPPGYRFITLAATVPAMMTLLTDVRCKFGTKKPGRLNGWTHVDGPPASNKSIVLSPIPVLMKPLQDIDDRNQAREDEWYEKKEQCVNKKEQPPKPKDIVIRILPANTTRHQHIKRMHDAGGKHTYTYCEEVQSLDLANRASFSQRSDFMQLLFDNGMTGNQSMHAAGMRCRTQVAWNLSTSGTRDQTLRTWGNCATNGATTRVFFCLVPDNSKAPMPQYVQYTEQDEAMLHRVAEIMMKMQGMVMLPRLDKALCDWVENVRQESVAADDKERLILKNRAADIAHKFGVVIHLAWMVQQIMDTEDREQRQIEVGDLDLSEMKERTATTEMALYAADQCLDGQYRLWARRMKQQLEAAYEGTAVFRKSERQYTQIPDEFTYAELQKIFPDKKIGTIRKMVERFKDSGTVRDAGVNEKGEKMFKKS